MLMLNGGKVNVANCFVFEQRKQHKQNQQQQVQQINAFG